MNVADLIPDTDYRFHLRLDRGRVAEFFGPTAERSRILEERKRWLNLAGEECVAVLPAGGPLLREAAALASELGEPSLTRDLPDLARTSPVEQCRALGTWWEPDFLLLKSDPDSLVRLYGGCVCFPSSWSLKEKIGQPIEAIHGVVPGLNDQLGPSIHAFLSRIKPGVAWLRSNWGLARSAELNQHPSRRLPRLEEGVVPEQVWFRVEHQALVKLPSGILFGIRLAVQPLTAILADPLARSRLGHALRTMPDAMAAYKGPAAARGTLDRLLNAP